MQITVSPVSLTDPLRDLDPPTWEYLAKVHIMMNEAWYRMGDESIDSIESLTPTFDMIFRELMQVFAPDQGNVDYEFAVWYDFINDTCHIFIFKEDLLDLFDSDDFLPNSPYVTFARHPYLPNHIEASAFMSSLYVTTRVAVYLDPEGQIVYHCPADSSFRPLGYSRNLTKKIYTVAQLNELRGIANGIV
jgi:hypothetical protein